MIAEADCMFTSPHHSHQATSCPMKKPHSRDEYARRLLCFHKSAEQQANRNQTQFHFVFSFTPPSRSTHRFISQSSGCVYYVPPTDRLSQSSRSGARPRRREADVSVCACDGPLIPDNRAPLAPYPLHCWSFDTMGPPPLSLKLF